MDYIIGQWQHPYTIFVTSPFLLLQAGVNDQRGEVAEVEQAVQLYGPVHLRAEDYHLPGQPKKKRPKQDNKKNGQQAKKTERPDLRFRFDLFTRNPRAGGRREHRQKRPSLLQNSTRSAYRKKKGEKCTRKRNNEITTTAARNTYTCNRTNNREPTQNVPSVQYVVLCLSDPETGDNSRPPPHNSGFISSP